MIFEYTPQGVCSRHFKFEIDNDIIRDVTITGGCPGNLQGISRLLAGMNIHDVIARFDGILCRGKPTSCPDQIAQALKSYLASQQ